MESDDRVLSLGVVPSTYEYLKFYQSFEDVYEESFSGTLLDLVITLDMDAIEHVRSIYTIWDVLGDTGGLVEMLYYLCYPIIILTQLVFNSGISSLLFETLFKIQVKTVPDDVFYHIK